MNLEDKSVNHNLQKYIKENIEPHYEKFYAHGKDHINRVVEQSFLIAQNFDVDFNMVYTAACYHDIGLLIGRSNHAKNSGKYLYNDKNLLSFFDEEQMLMLKKAVEDHSGSRKIPPRNIYGKIVSDADRDTSLEVLAIRQLPTSFKNYPELNTFEEHFERCYYYMKSRANTDKGFNLWCENEQMREALNQFAVDFFNKEYARECYLKAYQYYENNRLIKKIKNSPYE